MNNTQLVYVVCRATPPTAQTCWGHDVAAVPSGSFYFTSEEAQLQCVALNAYEPGGWAAYPAHVVINPTNPEKLNQDSGYRVAQDRLSSLRHRAHREGLHDFAESIAEVEYRLQHWDHNASREAPLRDPVADRQRALDAVRKAKP